MKCKNCDFCRLNWFTSKPDKYVCIGVQEPFVIDNIEHQCTEYQEYASKPDPTPTKLNYETIEDIVKYIQGKDYYSSLPVKIQVGRTLHSIIGIDTVVDMDTNSFQLVIKIKE